VIDVEDVTRDVLAADATVIGLVPAARIHLAPMPVDTVFPAITVQEVSTITDYTHDGPAVVRQRVTVDAWAKTKPAAKAIALAARNAIHAYGGSDSAVLDFMDAGRRPLYEPDTKLYRISSDFFAWSQDQAV